MTPETNPAGDIPDKTAYIPYSPPSGLYAITVPEGWVRTDNGLTVSFTDKLNTVAVATRAASVAPTTSSATSTEVPAIRSSSSGFIMGTVTSVSLTGGAAVLITYQANSAPDPVTGRVVPDAVERFEFFKSGTEAIVTLSGPLGADNVDPWRIVSNSFQWK